MELNIGIKDEQKEFLVKTVNDFSLSGIEEIIQALVKEILNKYDSKIVFEEVRCVGECFSNDQFIKVKFDENVITKMKYIFSQYDFEDYDSELEELSKVIRCIIIFADQECDLSRIFLK